MYVHEYYAGKKSNNRNDDKEFDECKAACILYVIYEV